MRLACSLLMLCAACSFTGGKKGPDGGPEPGELELQLDSAEDLSASATLRDVHVRASGEVEPSAWLTGVLLAEIDDITGPYEGTWSSKPARASMFHVGLKKPTFTTTLRGAPAGGSIVWFSGEIRLDAGVQHLLLTAATGADAFADVLRPDGSSLITCTLSVTCTLPATTQAGWYTLHMGWRRAGMVDFDLQWGLGSPTSIPADRLRAPASSAELAGWQLQGYEAPRSMLQVNNADLLNYKAPFTMDWTAALFDLSNGNPSYRSLGQLRISEAGSYDFKVTAQNKAAYRLLIDGEWLTMKTRFDPQPGTVRTETVTKDLTVGWHDIILEGYEHAGRANTLSLTYGPTGGALASPVAGDMRPVLGFADGVAAGVQAMSIPLERNASVFRTVTIAPVTGAEAPLATYVDVSIQLTPSQWNGVSATLTPPGGAAIPLPIDITSLVDDTLGEVHVTLDRATLGAVPVDGDWRVDVTHPDVSVDTGRNTVSKVRVNAHYAGSPSLGSPAKILAENASYARVVDLGAPHELRGLFKATNEPAGSKIELTAQTCEDAQGATCSAELTADALAAGKPTARFVKLTATFSSDGFVSPSLDKLTLRYLE
ncbi:MAG: hypothetical protein R3B48_23280 [Kofleriaceae bacterium]